MTEPDISTAKNKAAEMIGKYNPQNAIPFPFDALQKIKIKVSYNSSLFSSLSSPDSVASLLVFRAEDDQYVIFVNDLVPDTTAYFNVAVQIGHVVLHEKTVRECEMLFGSINSFIFSGDLSIDENECLMREARAFAYNLLMPDSLVKKAWVKLKDVDDLSKLFFVSPHEMTNRLKFLNLIDP